MHNNLDECEPAGMRPFPPFEEEARSSEVANAAGFLLPIELFGQIKPAVEGRWLLKRLLRASAAAVVFGYPGCGKSFLVLDWGLHVAAARDWFGRRVSKGAVVYIAAEGQGGARARIEAWKREHGPADDLAFALVPTAVDLFDATSGDLAKLNGDLAKLHGDWGRLDLVIVDTLNATMGAGDENGPDMGVYVGNVRRLCASFGCAWIIVTHVPLNGEAKRPRGHGSLWGTVDTAILVEGDRNAPARKATVIKQKDDDPGSPILFNLKQVPIGVDEEGDDVTSCVVVQSDLEPAQVLGRRKLSAKEAIVFAALERALISKGVFPSAEIPDNVIGRNVGKVVSLSEWRAEALASLASSDSKPDTARRTFDRARERMQAAEILGFWNDLAWLA